MGGGTPSRSQRLLAIRCQPGPWAIAAGVVFFFLWLGGARLSGVTTIMAAASQDATGAGLRGTTTPATTTGVQRASEGGANTPLPFLVYLPPALAGPRTDGSGTGATSWPLLLFLHGAGESGSDVRELISEGASGCPPVELAAGRAHPLLASEFVVVSPQTDRGWSAKLIQTFVVSILDESDGAQTLGLPQAVHIDRERLYW